MMSRKNAMWLCTLLCMLWGCKEDKETVVESGFEVTVTACLGSAPESADVQGCRAKVDASVQGACFVLADAEQNRKSTPLGWSDGRLQLLDADGLFDFTPGQPLEGALYLMTKPVDASTCASMAIDTDCTGDCLLKLYQEPKVVSPDGAESKTVFNFTDASGQCVRTWKSGGEPVELCNGVDDDCDGEIDEGFDDLGVACRTGQGACARTGFIQCNAEGNGVECNAVQGVPTKELCDGVDNDCNGLTDEQLEGCCTKGQFMRCGVDAGVCKAGTQTCNVSNGAYAGFFGPCLDENGEKVTLPGELPEVLDGVDNDCNGQIDEGFEGLGGVCTVGTGACAATGTYEMAPDGTKRCNATPKQPSSEVCDGIDNDCDGLVDEDLLNMGSCVKGEGACLSVGFIACMGGSPDCVVNAPTPTDEICNGIDDDCDGKTDEDFEKLGQSCGVIGQGVCAVQAVYACKADGSDVECVAVTQPLSPSPEVCDGLDNNCDGLTDEGFKDAQGNYVSLDHCGACGVPCSHPNAQSSCSLGVCSLLSCNEGYADADGLSQNGCECTITGGDVPDLSFADSDCDGIDGTIDAAIFVSILGDDNAFGTREAPFRSVARALSAAAATGKTEIYVSTGFFDIAQGLNAEQAAAVAGHPGLLVPDGVSIYGGYNPYSWSRSAMTQQVRTVIGGDAVVLRYEHLNADTVLQNLAVEATDATRAGSSSVAVVALDVGDHLKLTGVLLAAGNGANGLDGVNGSPASLSAAEGESGYASSLPVDGGKGGRGGVNMACSASGEDGADGVQSFDSAGSGAETTPATSGQKGADGVAASGNGAILDGLWTALKGSDASDGEPGEGGKGGKAGSLIAGEWSTGLTSDQLPLSSGGGGGGAGGCGGQGAKAAQGGGGSFALSLQGGTVQADQVTLKVGQAGLGGRAASGGSGAEGADGGPGGAAVDGVSTAGTSGLPGGEGGAGGDVPVAPNGSAAHILLINDGSVQSTVSGLDDVTSLCCLLESGLCTRLSCDD